MVCYFLLGMGLYSNLGDMAKIDRQAVWDKFQGRCAYTGKPLGDDWQVDHACPKTNYIWHQPWNTECVDDIKNLLPAIKIVNHYKRGHNIESFRLSMMNFHLRLRKLPKKTMVKKTEKRIRYMRTVAELFDITPDRPFSGKFYFETVT